MSKTYTERMQYLNRTGLYNGITHALLKDKVRNNFYSDILKSAKGKRVVDVGSGSGLLGFLALKHGAKHVTFIEQDKMSSQHIMNVIHKMKIDKSKYRVINDEFVASRWNEYELNNPDMIVHEIIGNFIWNETMTSAFDVHLPNVEIIPSSYQLKYSIVPLTDEGFKFFCDYENRNAKNKPGVDDDLVGSVFADYYTKVLSFYNTEVDKKPTMLNHIKDTKVLNDIYSKAIHHYDHVVNINDENDFNHKRRVKFKLPKTKRPYLILCEPFIHHGDYTLEFKSTSSFNGYNQPILVPPNLKCKYYEYVFDIQDTYKKIDNYYV
jgi:hypothetical protein